MAEFGELPGFLAEYPEVKLYEFLYNHNRREFQIGGKAVALAVPAADQLLRITRTTPVETEKIVETPLMMNVFGHPVTSPRFFTWLTMTNLATLFGETRKVMREVYGYLTGEHMDAALDGPVYGFTAGLMREGQVSLSVLGNLASIGPVLNGSVVEESEWDTGFAEYDLHNIDRPEQEVSLLAGIGHMATRCYIETN